MSIDLVRYDEIQKELKELSNRINNNEEGANNLYDDLRKRMNDVTQRADALTTAINTLMGITKQEHGLFQRCMLWIVATFAAMKYEGSSVGLRLILGDTQAGVKPDEDSKPTA